MHGLYSTLLLYQLWVLLVLIPKPVMVCFHESKPLQALVSEPVKPIIDTVVMSNTIHAYVSQSDKGELVIGAGTDSYTSYTQRGGFNIVEDTLMAIIEMFPIFSRMKMLRHMTKHFHS